MSPVTNVSQLSLLKFFLSRFNLDYSHFLVQLESYALSGGSVLGAVSSYKDKVKLLKRQSTNVILKGLCKLPFLSYLFIYISHLI